MNSGVPVSFWMMVCSGHILSSGISGSYGCQEPAWGIPPMAKVMRKEARQNAKAWSGFRGSPWVFLNIYPQKPESACFITVLFTLLTFSEKKLIQGFSLLHMKGIFQLKPLWWLSNLPERFPRTFTICDLLTAPQPREAQSLKHLKDTEPFLKS